MSIGQAWLIGLPTSDLEWRDYIRAGLQQRADDEAAQLERIKQLPDPEVPSRPATLEEIPRGAKTIGVAATRGGFDCRATYARGPRVDQYWHVVEISDSVMIRGRHEDGRRFGAMWITKTGQKGQAKGVTKWTLETSYLHRGGLWIACNATELTAYFQ
jgi:hypothetical protein